MENSKKQEQKKSVWKMCSTKTVNMIKKKKDLRKENYQSASLKKNYMYLSFI